jgi:hypothetical protein
MNMVIPNEGKAYLLDVALGVAPAEDLVVRLYQNNYTPVDGSTAGSFTAGTFTGSGAITVPQANWSASVIVSDVAQSDATPFPSWTHGGGAAQTVYGWYALTSVTGLCVMAQRFDAARNMTSGSTEALDPFRMKSKTFV